MITPKCFLINENPENKVVSIKSLPGLIITTSKNSFGMVIKSCYVFSKKTSYTQKCLSKLTVNESIDIINKLSKEGWSITELANSFKLSRSKILNVLGIEAE